MKQQLIYRLSATSNCYLVRWNTEPKLPKHESEGKKQKWKEQDVNYTLFAYNGVQTEQAP